MLLIALCALSCVMVTGTQTYFMFHRSPPSYQYNATAAHIKMWTWCVHDTTKKPLQCHVPTTVCHTIFLMYVNRMWVLT